MENMLPQKRLNTFEFEGVQLLESGLKEQVEQARNFYFNIPNDDILYGFRLQAGVAAPGKALGGWCANDAGLVFGQWLSGMARLSKATKDTDLREKALFLVSEWAKTHQSLKFDHYTYDKYVCGLVDMAKYSGYQDAFRLLENITDQASNLLSRKRSPASNDDSQGGYYTGDLEWYTLSENLYRAYEITKSSTFKEFGDVWLYPHFWDMFTGEIPVEPYGFHAYSHVNTLSSAAMAYAVTGNPRYLRVITGAYDYFIQNQCYATGGYGPGEKLVRPDGSLGQSIVDEPNVEILHNHVGRSFETPCGTWGVFKLCRYLLEYTGEARYGDWMEKVLYNGIRAALPMAENGKTFYYADYRLQGGVKIYHSDPWVCCSGTYLQDIAEFYNLIYFKNLDGIFVNLYVPSEVSWNHEGNLVRIIQHTNYPGDDTIHFTILTELPDKFKMSFRVPAWVNGFNFSVNNKELIGHGEPGKWAEITKEWNSGDTVLIQLSIEPRLVPIDRSYTMRAAWVYGPTVLVRTDELNLENPRMLQKKDIPNSNLLRFTSETQDGSVFMPFYDVGPGIPYQMYFDRDQE